MQGCLALDLIGEEVAVRICAIASALFVALVATGGASATTFNVHASGEVAGTNYSSLAFTGTVTDGTATGFATFFGYAGQTLEVQVTCIRVGPEGAGSFAIVTGPVVSGPAFMIGQQAIFGVIDNGDPSLDRVSGVFGDLPPGVDCTNAGLAIQGTFLSGPGVVIASPPPPPPLPTAKAECEDDGWKRFPIFANQGDCVSFVATAGKNEPKEH
jgi:hypothetical protein